MLDLFGSVWRLIGYGGRRCHACRTSLVTHLSPTTGKHACAKCADGRREAGAADLPGPGRASPNMTAHDARLNDATIGEAFAQYQRQRVNIAGQTIGYHPDPPTATAEPVKHNRSRVKDSLPNGYCGRPPQQDCPHPNACLTCPDFQTTPQFLDIHHRQAVTNLRLITRADANGHSRLAACLRQVQTSLERIIPALEAIPASGEPGDGRA